ncbi:hypothetical protein BDR06DRAFT_971262 [Suillus hirtellus]|nr:hypothetical protein BDR06DRAFT_971262 [Suillus hirtellus]
MYSYDRLVEIVEQYLLPRPFTDAGKRILSSQALSQNDLDPQNIDWSKVSSNVASHVSDALTEARQLVNQAAVQRDIDIQNIVQSKLLGNIVSSVTNVLTGAKRLVDQNVSIKDLCLTNIDWSKVLDDILSHASSALATAGRLVNQVFIYHNWCSTMAIMSQQYQEKLCPLIGEIFNIPHNCLAIMRRCILSSVLFTLTEVNNLSIRHPYKSAGALLVISAFGDHATFLTLLQLTRSGEDGRRGRLLLLQQWLWMMDDVRTTTPKTPGTPLPASPVLCSYPTGNPHCNRNNCNVLVFSPGMVDYLAFGLWESRSRKSLIIMVVMCREALDSRSSNHMHQEKTNFVGALIYSRLQQTTADYSRLQWTLGGTIVKLKSVVNSS